VGDLILGVEDDTHYDEETIPLGDSARLVIVSDGVTEAFDPSDEQYGTERIEHLLDSVQSCNARELVESFESSIEAFRKGRKAFDDTTLLVAQLT
jgi:sigma-B regulation protein RsbU (phosphoserine phosphatase)